jgi:hypothetical protein
MCVKVGRMDERPAQPPEGRLIAEALERSGLSIREASRRARLSYGRWRQITSGVQNVSPGEWARVTGPARTVARMAAVVGVTADQMAAAGREDVAVIIRDRPASQPDTDIAPAGVPEVVTANWDDPTVRQTWQNEAMDSDERLRMVLFYLAVVKAARERESATVTELRRANGA